MNANPAPAQYLPALELANRRRIAVARFRNELRAMSSPQARACVIELLTHPTGDVCSGRIGLLLNAIPGIGPKGLASLLHRAGVMSADRKLEQLTERQRQVIADTLRDWIETAPDRRWSR